MLLKRAVLVRDNMCSIAVDDMFYCVCIPTGSYEGHIMSYNSIVAAQNSELTHPETGAATPRARPMSRLAVVRHLYACPSPPYPSPPPGLPLPR